MDINVDIGGGMSSEEMKILVIIGVFVVGWFIGYDMGGSNVRRN